MNEIKELPVTLAGASAFPQDIPSEPSPEGKRILVASPRGYCAGVDRAVDAVEKALELYGAPVYVRKEIVAPKSLDRAVLEIWFDRRYRPVRKAVEGGELIPIREW